MFDSRTPSKTPLVFAFLITWTLGSYSTVQASALEFKIRPFLELQQRSYESAQWDRFFGAAQAYRNIWWQTHAEPELVLLEVLGLTRFCYFSEAKDLLTELRIWVAGQSEENPKLNERIEKNLSVIHSLEKMGLTVATSPESSSLSHESHWPAKKRTLKSIHPIAFRTHWVSRCR